MPGRVAVWGMLFASVACKGGDTPGGGPGPAAQGARAFAAWMPKDAASLWAGAWASRLTLHSNQKGHVSMAGEPAAIEIAGDKALVFDGKQEHQLAFSLVSPCQAEFREPITTGGMAGGTANHGMLYVVKQGALRVGSGAAGYRKGKAALVCAEGMNGGVTVVDDAGACVTWREKFGKLEQVPDTCAWTQADGQDLLTIGTGEWNTRVVADGDTLESAQFTDAVKNGLHQRATDFAAAKATTAATLEAKDPAAQAKKAGAVVGKTDTILSLTATYASDPAAWKGKPLEITARFLSASTSTSGAQTLHSVTLADSEDSTKFTLGCDLGGPPPQGLVQFDKVVAKGTLDEMFGRPELRGCTLTKAP